MIIGGTGTISSAVTRLVAQDKDWGLYLFNRGNHMDQIPENVKLIKGDITNEAEAAKLLSDILTYAGTEITKYIIGDNSMDSYETFTSTLEDMGVDRVVEIYQAAYDRYLNK